MWKLLKDFEERKLKNGDMKIIAKPYIDCDGTIKAKIDWIKVPDYIGAREGDNYADYEWIVREV